MLLSGTPGKGLEKGVSRMWGMISLPHGLEPGGGGKVLGCRHQAVWEQRGLGRRSSGGCAPPVAGGQCTAGRAGLPP